MGGSELGEVRGNKRERKRETEKGEIERWSGLQIHRRWGSPAVIAMVACGNKELWDSG